MLSNADHADTMLSTITKYVKSSPSTTTRDTVIQFLCQDGEVVTTDRSLLLCYSPFLRSVVCSAPSTTSPVISLPDASSSGLEAVLNMIGQAWVEDIYVLTEEQLGVVRTLGIPCGGVEKVQIVDFGANNVEAGTEYFPANLGTESSKPKQDDLVPSESFSLICTRCEMDFGELNEDSKDELAIHIGEIHSEMELLAEFYKIFPGGSNTCEVCGYKVSGEYVQKEHILLHHPWQMLKDAVDELCRPARCGNSDVGILAKNAGNDEKVKETKQKEISKVKIALVISPLPVKQPLHEDVHGHANANSKPSDVDNNKAKKSKRGRKRKCELETSESPKSSLVFPYVPERKSAKKASLYISKAFKGEKRYKQQDIGMFVRKVDKVRENKEESELSSSNLNDTCELMDDIDRLLKDSDDDDEEETLGLEISYANSEIEGIQDYIEFSDSDSEDKDEDVYSEDKNKDVLNYSIKVENKSLTENDKADKDLLEIQNGIMYSDSEEEE